MIRVSVLYPNEPGAKFDHKYYMEKHMKLAKQRLGPFWQGYEIDKGVAGRTLEAPPPFVVVAYSYFNSIEDFRKPYEEHGDELLADIPNYTSIRPQVQVSEIQIRDK